MNPYLTELRNQAIAALALVAGVLALGGLLVVTPTEVPCRALTSDACIRAGIAAHGSHYAPADRRALTSVIKSELRRARRAP